MNDTIDDFFNEINDLDQSKDAKQKQPVWQECYDELTGYSYYWNTKTDEVTWTTPAEYKPAKEKEGKKDRASPKKSELYVPPRIAPLLPSTSATLSESLNKVYSVGSTKKLVASPVNNSKKKDTDKKQSKKRFRRDSSSDEEKIELISSYGGDTESESDEEPKTISENDYNNDKPKGEDSNASDDDDVDILTKIQKRAKELKEMGGELPPEVATVVNTPSKTVTVKKPAPPKEKKVATGGFSLVAGYSDSEEELENEEVASIFALPEPPKVAHSTLFPITKPIDVKDFLQQEPVENKPENINSNFDSKAFQRKRRIGIALVNTGKKKEETPEESEAETKGLGFKSDDSAANAKNNVYPGFKKGGVMFVKSDVLHPQLPKPEGDNAETKAEEGEGDVKRKDLEEIYTTLMEKLGFLSEGRPQVSPVQVMIIQAETLFEAMKENGLKLSYLQRWLNDTHADLIKLEKEAAPDGWLLQWDRSHKRYYYQNQTTGEGQWEYPQPDISRCDEAMDISTTPPPAEPAIHVSPPLPPTIRSPTPPPPPYHQPEGRGRDQGRNVPLPPEPTPPPAKFLSDGEPLPPGVDLPELMAISKSKEKEVTVAVPDPLCSALDSFYSDIASMENTNSTSSPPPPRPPAPVTAEETKAQPEVATEAPKKKKKAKVKLAPGLTMKKKGVSQLVEKWKSVQQHYND
ncbi:hypothetical protein NQ315_015452 [Exocentrus adspersus]|uniref:WW domain-containing protein n=1 Tax=Exocentrus adspersus TaxID=1586481 RepID=A0AAV8VLY1_9CUCU|nr:hypothetical protein NQ315_015452 [Exocentrus adspersus]